VNEPFKISPTKVKDYASCPRRWFCNYILDLKPPPTAKMARGTEVHEKLENFYLKGLLPEDPKLLKVLELSPPREEGVQSETWLPIELPGNILVRQKADIIDLRNPLHPKVYDFKTMGNFNYALTPEQLREDIQLVSYAYAVASIFAPDAMRITVAHIQIPLDIVAEPRLISAELTLEEVLTRWEYTESRYIREMYEDSKKTIGQVKANFGAACKEYGGCKHFAICAKAEHDGGLEMVDSTHPIVNQLPKAELQFSEASKKGLTREDLARRAEAPKGAKPIKFLFIDCMPVTKDLQIVNFAEIMSQVAANVAKVSKVPDWRLHDYGKGKGLISAELGRMDITADAIFVSTRDDLSSLAIEHLSARSETVVMGLK
jgi:hypothetical protein